MFTCTHCGGPHLSSDCFNNNLVNLNSRPILPLINDKPTSFPTFDLPKNDFNLIKSDPLNYFDLGKKKHFDGGVVNIIEQKRLDLRPPPGSPMMMDSPGTRPLHHTVAPPPIPGRPPMFL